MSWLGMDPARARYVGGRVVDQVAVLDGVRSNHRRVIGLAADWEILAGCRTLHSVLEAEAGALSTFMVDVARLVEAADSGVNHHVLGMMDSALGGKAAALSGLLGDGIGSTGTDAERRWQGIPISIGSGPHCAGPGDLGGTYSTDPRLPWLIHGVTGADRGRNLVIRALADTGDPCQIGVDEFEIVQIAEGRYVVVLPGVTDLSAAADDPLAMFSWNEDHRSVRATWMAARTSALSTGIEGNRYAAMVDEAMAAEVPPGSDVVIIGHSFGADTALDLAADASFHGPQGRYNVTHVVAAAYHSAPQLAHVPDSVEVLVLQNSKDLVIVGESALDQPSAAIHGAAGAYDSARDLEFADAHESLGDAAEGVGRSIIEGAGWFGDRHDELSGAALDAAVDHLSGMDVPVSEHTFGDAFYLEVGVATAGLHTSVVFDGGSSHGGHHQEHYIHYVEETAEHAVGDFFASLDAAGYTSGGSTVAVDVSVPADD